MFMAKSYLGIDIGYDTLKLALVSGKQVKKVATAAMPKRLMRDGRIVSPEAMGELIRNTMKENGIRCSQAALNLSSDAVFLRNVTVPLMTEDQLNYNLPYEFRDYITDELKNYVFDYAMLSEPVSGAKSKPVKAEKAPKEKKKKQTALEAFEAEPGEAEAAEAAAMPVNVPAEYDVSTGDTMELMAVAAPITLMQESREILRKAGMKLKKAAPSVCSYVGLIRSMNEDNRPASGEYCIIDLGYQAIRMHMFKGDRHVVTRALEFGLSSVDDAVADAYNVDVHLAHTYLTSNYDNCQQKECCLNAFNNIAVELLRAMNFYRFSNPDSALADVWVCGGGAAIAPLFAAIQNTLDDMRLHPASELIRGDRNIENSSSYVQAIGIALD